jgi:hypothetical protein
MAITRVHYRERQRLTAADLLFEQSDRLGMAGRHHLGAHEWGVIRGLRVVRLENGRFRLLPGVAIDGYGRELLVPQPVDLVMPGFDDNLCRFVHLYQCEDPEQIPPGRACQDSPAPRIRQRTAIRITDSLFLTADVATDLLTARAAGTVPGSEPWPILVARIGKGCPPPVKPDAPLIDYSQVTYVSHRAAPVHAPTGNALLQLGLASLTDVYNFLVSTRDTRNALNKRLGIDRDHSLHVWKPLFISGAQAQGEVELGDGLKMQITMPMPAGLGRMLRIDGSVDPELRTLSASLFEIGRATRDVMPVHVQNAPLSGKTASLAFERFSTASASLLDSTKASRLTFGNARRKFLRMMKRSAAVRDVADGAHAEDGLAFSMQLGRAGGRLSLIAADLTADATAIPCGDVARTRGALGVPSTGMALLRPAEQIDADPLLREIHAVVTAAPTDPVPKTELHISGGGADDSDASGRLSVGVQAGSGYVAALRMDGAKRIRLLAGPQVTGPQPLLAVERTVYLPAIGKKDPLLTDLMALAYMSGLFQIGNVYAAFKIELHGDTTNGSTYNVTVTSPGGIAFTIKRTLELIIGKDGPADMSVRALVEIPPGATSVTAQTKVSVPGLAPSGRKVIILILMLVESGNATRVAYSAPLTHTIP